MDNWNTLKNHHLERNIFLNRAKFSFLLVSLLSLILLGRMFFLQILEFEKYATASDKNRIQVVPMPPNRGLIYDRKGKLLANNIPSFSVSVVEEKSEDLDGTIKKIGSIITLTDEQISRFKKKAMQYHRPYEPILLRSKLSEDDIAKLSVNRHEIPSMKINAELVRNYPHMDHFAHSVGYVGRMNEKELSRLQNPSNYKGSNYYGKTGLERSYQEELHGFTGSQKIETDAHGEVLRVIEQEFPKPGKNLHLYLDLELQKISNNLLKGKRGAIIAIEPKTGGVLAFVSKPSFNPNLFVTGISQKNYSALRDSPDQPLFNRTIQGRYPPGSTVKPILGLAGLEYNKTTWWSRMKDPGWYKLESEDRLYRDWKRKGHGNKVGLSQAIYESCDVYFYDLAFNLGIDNIHEFMDKFGFGKKTGIDISPESEGLLPSREWKRKTRKVRWFPGETLIVGIGQGYMLATPLQLAVSTAILANKGIQVTPRLVKEIKEAEETNGNISKVASPIKDNTEVTLANPNLDEPVFEAEKLKGDDGIYLTNEDNWDQMFKAMHKVMKSPKGTAYGSGRGLKYSFAGKTGTAQVKAIAQGEEYDESKIAERHRDHGLFVGFAPIKDPQIAIAVMVENGGSGSAAAAPLARKIFDAYLLK